MFIKIVIPGYLRRVRNFVTEKCNFFLIPINNSCSPTNVLFQNLIRDISPTVLRSGSASGNESNSNESLIRLGSPSQIGEVGGFCLGSFTRELLLLLTTPTWFNLTYL